MSVAEDVKGLVSLTDIAAGSPIIEYFGNFSLLDEYKQKHNKGSTQSQSDSDDYTLKYRFVLCKLIWSQSVKIQNSTEHIIYLISLFGTKICIDATKCGSEARFVRRSEFPNASVESIIHNGRIHIYLYSSTHIEKQTEVLFYN